MVHTRKTTMSRIDISKDDNGREEKCVCAYRVTLQGSSDYSEPLKFKCLLNTDAFWYNLKLKL